MKQAIKQSFLVRLRSSSEGATMEPVHEVKVDDENYEDEDGGLDWVRD
jgi:hypothetical protein